MGITLGNSKGIDLLAEQSGCLFKIEVKAIQHKKRACWNIKKNKIKDDIYYILVNLNVEENEKILPPDYYIGIGKEIRNLIVSPVSGIDTLNLKKVDNKDFRDRWDKIKC